MTKKLRRRAGLVEPVEDLEIEPFDDAPLHADAELDLLPSDLERLRRARSDRPPPMPGRMRLASGR